MIQRFIALLLVMLFASPVQAQIIGALPYTLTNGQVADANQVMANFNAIVSSTNANAAGAGINTNITALNGLSTPITPAQGGSSLYIGGTASNVGNAYTILSPAPTGFSLTLGKSVCFTVAAANTGPTTLNVNSTGATNFFNKSLNGPAAMVGGELVVNNNVCAIYDGTQFQCTNCNVGVPLRSFLAGLILSTPGASTTFSVAAGVATNSTNVDSLTLPASISKTTASWAVGTGNGSLDTGSIVASTWYHVYLIKRTDTGVVDVIVSLSATSPALPASYTEFRRIGSLTTGPSSNWAAFSQNGDEFLWVTPVTDVNGITLPTGSTPTPYNLPSVPPGIKVNALIILSLTNSTTAGASALLTPLDTAGTAAGTPTGNVSITVANTTTAARMVMNIRTSGGSPNNQVQAVASVTSTLMTILTYGWIDRRGRDN